MDNASESPGTPRLSRPVMGIVLLTGLILLVGIASGFGTRFGFWNFRTGFTILRWAVYGILVLIVWDVYLFARTISDPGLDRVGVILSLIVLIVCVSLPLSWYSTARSVPPIHDITTDTQSPPTYTAIVPLRKDASNPVAYPGKEVAKQQQEAYPDIRPLILPGTFDQVFPLVKDTVNEMNWEIVSVNQRKGRIEAVDTTFWFGFKDDIVVRLTEQNDQTRVDIRSKSRVGKSDVGTNARRIRQFKNRLESRFN